MSVKLILSNTYDMSATCIFNDDLKKVKTEKCIVIVPDKYTFSIEKTILEKLDIECSFDIEVVSFSRLATKTMKNHIKKCLSPEGTVMLLRRAIFELNKENKLSFFTNVDNIDFPHEMYGAITSLRNSGIKSDEILEKYDSGKLYEIGLIYERYIHLLNLSFSDGSTRLEEFAGYVDKIEDISKTNIFILYFDDFTSPQYLIIDMFMKYAKNVTIGLISPENENANVRIYNTKPIKKIRNIAKNAGIKLDEKVHNDESLKPYKKSILYGLFSYRERPRVCVGENEEVEVFSAVNAYEEIEFIARTIKEKVGKGDRYRNNSLVLCDFENYQNIVETVFNRFEIPFFMDKKLLLSSTPSAKYLLSALNVIIEKYSVKSVFDFIKNPIFLKNASRRDVEIFEYFVRENSIKVIEPNKKLDDISADNIRNKVFYATKALNKEITNVLGFVDAINEFIDNNDIERYLDDNAKSNVCNEIAESQFIDKLKNVLNEMKNTMSNDMVFEKKEFLDMLKSVFQNVKLSMIPKLLDCVFVGRLDDFYDDVDTMFFAGAIEGYFPSVVHDTAVLGRAEEDCLKSNNLEIYPTKVDVMHKNCLNMIQLLVKAKEHLYITYPETFQGKNTLRAAALEEISRYLDNKRAEKEDDKIRLVPTPIDNSVTLSNYKYVLSTRKNSMYKFSKDIVKNSKDKHEIYNSVFDLLDESEKEQIEKLVVDDDGKKDELNQVTSLSECKFSASKLENYFACPYQYFFRYGLNVKPWKNGKLSTLETGVISHAILEKFVEEKGYEKPTDEKLKCIVNSAIDEVMSRDDYKKFKNVRNNATIERMRKEGVDICKSIAEQIQNSDFKPCITEGKIGKSAEAKFNGVVINIGDKEYNLVGSIDRIDKTDDGHFSIIDYKSFKKDISFKDVFTGTKIQPILYMRATSTDATLKYPSAVLYQPVSVGYKSKDETRFKMKGFVLKQSDIIRQLDTSLADGSSSKYIPASLTSKGNPDGRIKKNILDVTFTGMSAYSEKLAKTALEEILSGNINPAPIDRSCEFCDASPICPYADNDRFVRNKFPEILPEYFMKLANGEVVSTNEENEGGSNND